MLSLKSGTPIAIINNNKDKQIYYKESERNEEAEIDTDKDQKIKILKNYLSRNDTLKNSEIQTILDAYSAGSILPNKVHQKLLEKGIDYVNKSLKRYLDFGKNVNLFPIITEPSYRMLVSGGSGSGKTFFVSEFLKVNKVKKSAGIFIFSPFDADESIQIKDIIKIKLETYEQEYEREFNIEDLPQYSVCILDDVFSYKKDYRQLYIDVMEQLYERGRHLNISTIMIQHNPMMGANGKIQLRDSMYYTVFPKYNLRDTKALLKSYTGITTEQLQELLDTDSRWVFLKKSIPNYWVSQHEIGLLHN
jgi:hypothetical protein